MILDEKEFVMSHQLLRSSAPVGRSLTNIIKTTQENKKNPTSNIQNPKSKIHPPA